MGFMQKMRKKLQLALHSSEEKTVEEINQEIRNELATMMSVEYFTILYQSDLSAVGYKLALSLGNFLGPANTVQFNVVKLTTELDASGSEIVQAIHELENIKAIVYLKEQEAYLCNPHFIYNEDGCYSKEHLQLCAWWDNVVAKNRQRGRCK